MQTQVVSSGEAGSRVPIYAPVAGFSPPTLCFCAFSNQHGTSPLWNLDSRIEEVAPAISRAACVDATITETLSLPSPTGNRRKPVEPASVGTTFSTGSPRPARPQLDTVHAGRGAGAPGCRRRAPAQREKQATHWLSGLTELCALRLAQSLIERAMRAGGRSPSERADLRPSAFR